MLSVQGTQIYDAKAGGWRDLGMLDVMQVQIGYVFGLSFINVIMCVSDVEILL